MQSLAQPGLVTAVADDEKAEVFHSHAFELLLNLHKQPNVLFDREAADEAEDALAVLWIPRALGRMEELRVHAARHQMAGPAGCFFELRAQLGIGRKEHLRNGVELGRSRHGEVFNLLAGGGGLALGQQAQEPVGAARGVLVDVGVPTGGEGQVRGGAPATRPACRSRWGR